MAEAENSGVELEKNESRESNENKMMVKKNKKIKIKKKKQKLRNLFIPRFPCMKLDDEYPTIDEQAADGSFNMQATDRNPTHLVVMVNGIIGSAQNWRYTAKQFVKAYPKDVIVHCSESNSSMLTFDGVDVMGTRLADEVLSVIQRHPNLQKISFIGHSLGGLVARYAIAKLYKQEIQTNVSEENGDYKVEGPKDSFSEDKSRGKIAGLEPVNFITSATPNLGSRGHKQVPVFCGFYPLERFASRTSGLLGRTGKHLFLVDRDGGKPPLLLRMATDSEDLKFISALQSFKRRVAYANIRFDHLVGWSTSSLRRRSELPKRRSLLKNDKYPHIVNEETAMISNPQEISLDVNNVNQHSSSDMEEAMLRGLTKMSWERVDVNFTGSKQRFFAHNTIQVQTYCTNSDGADVIRHTIDKFLL